MSTWRREILLLFFVALYSCLTVTCISQTVHKVKENAETDFRDSRIPLRMRRVRFAVSDALGEYSDKYLEDIFSLWIFHAKPTAHVPI